MDAGYHALPIIYDRWQRTYGKSYSELILPRVLKSIRQHGIPRGSLADLACGTGTLAFAMARQGWRAWGVDASSLMLSEAGRKQAARARKVSFLQQDMRSFRLPQPVDVVTCLFDSVNHLLSRVDLLRTFRSVAASLTPGGWFIFDVNNEHCYKLLWRHTEAVHHKDFTLVLKNGYDTRRRDAYSLVTVFLRDGEKYRKMTEVVRERYFPSDAISAALRRAGFRVAAMEEFNFTSRKDLGNIKQWWVAQRR